MVIWGGYGSSGAVNSGARYDPVTNAWSPTSTSGAPQARTEHTMLWTGNDVIVWGGTPDFSEELNTGALYDPVADEWTPTSVGDAPSPRTDHTAVWTGDEMIVWGDNCLDPDCVASGGRYGPSSDSWQATSLENVPETRGQHTAVWTGNEMIVWGGIGVQNGIRNTGGRYYAETSGNDAPVAADDSYETDFNSSLIVPAPGVLANDEDPDGDSLTAILVNEPAHGALILNPDGSFTYEPDAGYSGVDSFTYRAFDGQMQGNVATVGIAIQGGPTPTATSTVPTATATGTVPTATATQVPPTGTVTATVPATATATVPGATPTVPATPVPDEDDWLFLPFVGR
jgi:hypothetical protein